MECKGNYENGFPEMNVVSGLEGKCYETNGGLDKGIIRRAKFLLT